MEEKKLTGRKKWKRIVFLTIGIVIVALFVQAGILMYVNSKNADKTSQVLLEQVIQVLEKNQENESDLIQSMKEDYIVRAKAVAYYLDAQPAAESDVEELRKIAELMSVDEIDLFDETGTIYSGSEPDYYGYSFDSGEQMAYFKPMLKDKSLTMCQDITPNTSEGKSMMYAITWNTTGNKMIQVGIEPVRLMQKIKQNEVANVVSNIPMSQGMKLYVADADTHEILGATDEDMIGKSLERTGISRSFLKGEETVSGITRIHGEKYNCVFRRYGDYLVGVTLAISADNESNLVAILVVAVYLIIACTILLILVARVLRANQEKKEQFGILASMAGIYNRMYLINLENDSMIAYSDHNSVQATAKERGNADQTMHDLMDQTVLDAYKEKADAFADLHTVADRMKGKKIISGEFVSKELGWFRASFITIETDINDKPVKAIFTIRIIENEKQKEETLIETSNTDELTGCLNRRAYEKDIRSLFPSTEFAYVSMDVNGLKIVNDSLGHAAGDELLRGASYCIRKTFERYGKVYRIGGDEFAAIVFTNMEQFGEIREMFEQTVETWRGEQIDSMTISYGVVSSREKQLESVSEIAHAADIRMYEKKAMYYSRHGVDRRGQPAAYIALCKLYAKVLKVDLNEDSFRVLSWEEPKKEEQEKAEMGEAGSRKEGATGCLSVWLGEKADTDQIHPDDVAGYRTRTDLEYMKNYLDENREPLSICCRKRNGGSYTKIAMELVPTDEYTEETRTAFLYIKG